MNGKHLGKSKDLLTNTKTVMYAQTNRQKKRLVICQSLVWKWLIEFTPNILYFAILTLATQTYFHSAH